MNMTLNICPEVLRAAKAIRLITAVTLMGIAPAVAMADSAPVITTQPLSHAVFSGDTMTMVVAASGTPAPTFQWQKDGINIPGATSSSFTLNNIQLSDIGNYAAVATNTLGQAASRLARLVVLVPRSNELVCKSVVYPTGVTAGGKVSLDYLLTNVGTKNWGSNHYFSIRDNSGNFVAFASLIGANSGESKSVNLNFTAPSTAGTYTYMVQALEGGVEFFGPPVTFTLNVFAPLANSATYNATNFPVTTSPGAVVNFTYNITNTGTKNWGTRHFLSLRDGNNVFQQFAPVNALTLGQSKTINLQFTAPSAPGTYTYYVQALEDSVEFFNTQVVLTLTVLAPQPNATSYLATRFLDTAMPGATVNLRYSFSNDGTTAWGANHYATLRDANGTFLSFVSLDGVAPGSTTTVNFSFIAPNTAGTYSYYVQLMENGVEFFSTQSLVTLTVLGAQASNGITYNSGNFPNSAVSGATVNFSYTVTNRGTAAWGAKHYLSLRDADSTFLGFLPLSGVAPGGTKTVNFTFTAPIAPGVYTYYVQAVESGVEFFNSQETLTLVVLPAVGDAELARFLIQASFGPSGPSLGELRSMTYAGWIDAQLAMAPTYHMPYYKTRVAEFMARSGGTDNGYFTPRQEAWWQNSLTAPDQLRQRMAFALSEIFVISQDSSLDNENEGATAYYDMLIKNSFGNFRKLLDDVTLSPMMGSYLSMIRNQKPNVKTNRQPDENYAREIMQLFSIGLSQLNVDGSLKLDSNGQAIPTYTQDDIVGLAHVFTGWGANYDPAIPPKWSDGTTAKPNDWFLYGWDPLRPMTFNATYGDLQTRQIVGGVTVASTLNGPQRLALALDTLYNHPNVGPFIGRQLIQRFVTSNPSPAYVRRVAAAFNSNASGVRGDLGYTLRAVLLDPEARSAQSLTDPRFGKLTEPLLRMTRLFRAFPLTPRPYADNRMFLNYVYSMDEEAPLFSPTVFNFFKPGFSKAGAIATAGLVSPEFQIFDDVTAMLEANRNYSLINSGVSVGEPVNVGTNMKLDLTEPLAVLSQPGKTPAEAQAALVEYFNQRLMGGTMSPFLRKEMLDTYTSLPTTFTYTTANQLKRVQLGLYLVLFSPEFNVHR